MVGFLFRCDDGHGNDVGCRVAPCKGCPTFHITSLSLSSRHKRMTTLNVKFHKTSILNSFQVPKNRISSSLPFVSCPQRVDSSLAALHFAGSGCYHHIPCVRGLFPFTYSLPEFHLSFVVTFVFLCITLIHLRPWFQWSCLTFHVELLTWEWRGMTPHRNISLLCFMQAHK